MYDFQYNDILFEFERSTDIENCISFDLKSMPEHCSALDELVDSTFIEADLKSLITAKGKKTFDNAAQRIKNDLRSVLWHLYEAHIRFGDCFVRVPLKTTAYAREATRNPHNISRDVRNILHRLDDNGLLEIHKGFLDRTRYYGKTTRIRARGPLLENIGLLPKHIQEAHLKPKSIEFRLSGDKEMLPIDLCIIDPSLLDVESLLDRYNQVLYATGITLGDVKLSQLSKKIHLQRKSLTAIYHIEADGSLTYGRMHGAFWQVIPKDMRHHILIENCPTVELDYSAQVLNIVSSLAGIQLQGDGYDIDIGLGHLKAGFQRDFVKSLIVVMLNAGSRASGFKAIRQKYKSNTSFRNASIILTNEFLETCLETILKKHPFLHPYIASAQGKKIFLIDSDIAREIIAKSLEADFIVLPIHDGFICKVANERKLQAIMQEVWHQRFGTSTPIKRGS